MKSQKLLQLFGSFAQAPQPSAAMDAGDASAAALAARDFLGGTLGGMSGRLGERLVSTSTVVFFFFFSKVFCLVFFFFFFFFFLRFHCFFARIYSLCFIFFSKVFCLVFFFFLGFYCFFARVFWV